MRPIVRRSFLSFLLGAALCVYAPLPLAAAEEPRSVVTVMTRNVYVGFDVEALLEPDQTPDLGAALAALLATDFSERAEVLADEILRTRPHLVGLQEVALLRFQSPGDSLTAEPTPGEEVLYDYSEVLLAALAARGLDYRPAAAMENADVELPLIMGTQGDEYDDIRFTDRDMILARGDVGVSNPAAVRYEAILPTVVVEAFGTVFEIDVPRGFGAAKE